ncbi:MAG: sterol carrier family protein [Candidatus Nanopelagicales bacterium]
MPARKPVPTAAGAAALAEVQAARIAGLVPSRTVERTAVRFLLEELARRTPGNSVEVRVPPYAAVQAVPGPRHTRGTPPAIVEMAPATWLALATGLVNWNDAMDSGAIRASGVRADLRAWLPLNS